MFSYAGLADAINSANVKSTVDTEDKNTHIVSCTLPNGIDIIAVKHMVNAGLQSQTDSYSITVRIDDNRISVGSENDQHSQVIYDLLLTKEYSDDDLLKGIGGKPEPTQEDIKNEIMEGLVQSKEILALTAEIIKSDEMKEVITGIVDVAAQVKTQTNFFTRAMDKVFGRKKASTKKKT